MQWKRKDPMKRFSLLGAAVLAFATTTSPARAGFKDTLTVGNNSYEDVSREEIFFHTNNPNTPLGIGDVITGFSQIQTKTGGPRVFDTIYVAFSQTITGVSGGVFTFGPTSASDPHSLQSILPGSGIADGALAAVFDRPQGSNFPLDLVNQAPSGATSIADYLKNIAANGTLEATYGFSTTSGQHDFFTAVENPSLPAGSLTPAKINASPNSVTLASFDGGLTMLQNFTGLPLGPSVLGDDLTNHDLSIVSGSVRGAKDNKPAGINLTYGGAGPNTAAVGNNASFVVQLEAVAPEPSSIVLLSVGLFGFAGRSILRRKKAVTA
jgi:hypothetical protein